VPLWVFRNQVFAAAVGDACCLTHGTCNRQIDICIGAQSGACPPCRFSVALMMDTEGSEIHIMSLPEPLKAEVGLSYSAGMPREAAAGKLGW
jgi:hypothetical protein